MTVLQWDQVGDRLYETGVDHGVLYQLDEAGAYGDGVPWNGLTTVTESPSGAESNKQYADNIGLAYRSLQGNDTEGQDHGYKLHLIYGAQASPSEKAYTTVNDSPEAIAFSWEFSSTPAPVSGRKPTSLLTIDSTKSDPTDLQQLEDILFGTVGDDARLPTPDEVIALFGGGTTNVDLGTSANQPQYNAGTHVLTLPTVTGVQWKVNGTNKAPGAQPALTAGQTAEVEAVAQAGFNLQGDDEWTFDY
jgi:hypothetical protein